jgi:glutathione S-transferase
MPSKAHHYILYGHANTASTGTHWLLQELVVADPRVTYEFVDVDLPSKAQRDAGYLALNPKGRVPTLVVHDDSGTPLAVSESGAIALLLAERYPAAFHAPAPATAASARFLQAHIFVVNTILPALRDWFYAEKDQTDQTVATGLRKLALRRLRDAYALLDEQVGSGYLAGAEPTVADFVFTATLSWNGFVEAVSAQYPNLKAYRDRMRARPSWAKILELEKEQGKLSVRDWEKEYL